MSTAKRVLSLCIVMSFIMMVNIAVFRRIGLNQSTRTISPRMYQYEDDDSQKNYMIALILPEQLTMCTIHFHQLQNVVNDWNFTGVEPFAYGSTMFGLRSLNAKDPYGSLPFNKLFNATMHNRHLSECMKRPPDPETGFPVLFEPMIEFLRRSYRKLVLVYFAGHRYGQHVLTKDIYDKMEAKLKNESDPYTDCSLAAKDFGVFSQVESLFSKEIELEETYPTVPWSMKISDELNNTFEVVQAFCVNQKVKLSLSELRDFVFDHMNGLGEVSIVFISWQGRFTHSMIDDDAKAFINKCRLPFSNPFHSDYIKSLAQKYIQSELKFKEQPYLSVHVRSEKLLSYIKRKNYKSMNPYLKCCMNRLNSLIAIVREKFNISDENVLLNWDYSPYGSTCSPVPSSKKIANSHLKEVNVKPSYFEPKRFNLTQSHRGLISLVEMHALYRGKALVTVGEGSYQLTTVQTFIDHHQDSENPDSADKLHYGHLCIPPEQLHEVSENLEPKCLY